MILAYLLRVVNSELTRTRIVIGWIIATTFLLTDVLDIFIHEAFHDATRNLFWSLFIAWIIFVCHHLKSGSILQHFLSHRLWLPLSRLNLGMYLIHYVYIKLTVANRKQLSHLDFHWLLHISLGDIIVSVFLAVIMFLIIEAPGANLVSYCQAALTLYFDNKNR